MFLTQHFSPSFLDTIQQYHRNTNDENSTTDPAHDGPQIPRISAVTFLDTDILLGTEIKLTLQYRFWDSFQTPIDSRLGISR